jgi:hypothetical protein
MPKKDMKTPLETPFKVSTEQPRVISSDGTTDQAVQPFLSTVFTERQKLGKTPMELQLVLGEDTDGIESQAAGLDLTISEDRALHAIQKKLTETDYKGNEPGRYISSSVYGYDGYLPVFSFESYSEYYALYGLKADENGSYRGGEREQALEALRGLTRPFMIIEDKKPDGYKDGKATYHAIRATMSVIKLREEFHNLTEEEVRQVEAGHELPDKRHTKITVEVSPLLMLLKDTFYTLLPPTLHDDIKEFKDGKRPSRAISLFIEYLHTLKLKKPYLLKVSKERLAYRLRLDGYIRQRKQPMVDKRLQEALDYALESEYILKYKETSTGLIKPGFYLWLNPEKFSRIRKKSQEEEETG